MAVVNYTNNGDGTSTLTLTYANVNKPKADAMLSDAARYMYESMGIGDHGTDVAPRTWADLTNNEKLQLVGVGVKNWLLSLAHTYHVNAAADTARNTANAEVGSLYDF